jgi:hypothetical protein
VDGGNGQVQAVLVEAGDGVAEADRVPGGEAGRDADDVLFPAGCWQASAVERADGGVPVDCGRAGGAVVDEAAGEILGAGRCRVR